MRFSYHDPIAGRGHKARETESPPKPLGQDASLVAQACPSSHSLRNAPESRTIVSKTPPLADQRRGGSTSGGIAGENRKHMSRGRTDDSSRRTLWRFRLDLRAIAVESFPATTPRQILLEIEAMHPTAGCPQLPRALNKQLPLAIGYSRGCAILWRSS